MNVAVFVIDARGCGEKVCSVVRCTASSIGLFSLDGGRWTCRLVHDLCSYDVDAAVMVRCGLCSKGEVRGQGLDCGRFYPELLRAFPALLRLYGTDLQASSR